MKGRVRLCHRNDSEMLLKMNAEFPNFRRIIIGLACVNIDCNDKKVRMAK